MDILKVASEVGVVKLVLKRDGTGFEDNGKAKD